MSEGNGPAPGQKMMDTWKKLWIATRLWASVIAAGLVLGGAAHWVYWVSRGRGSLMEGGILAVGGVVQLIIRNFVAASTLENHDIKALEPSSSLKSVIDNGLALGSEYPAGSLALLSDLLIDPAKFRTRVTERITLGRNNTHRTVMTTFEIPVQESYSISEDNSILVPVMVPPKGHLYDRESIEDGSNRNVAPLATAQSVSACVAVVISTFAQACKLTTEYSSWGDEDRSALHNLVGRIVRFSGATGNAEQIAKFRRVVLDDCAVVRRREDVDVDAVTKLERLVVILAERYPVIAELPRRKRFTLTYANDISTRTLDIDIPKGLGTSWTRLTQGLLNLQTGYVAVRMAQARNCQSYHLYIDVPSGSYVGPTQAVETKKLLRGTQPETLLSTPYSMWPIRTTTTMIHAYGRGLETLAPGSRIEARVYERPYGTELFGALACISMLALAIVLERGYGKGRDIDAGVIAVGLPVALATFGGFFGNAIKRTVTASKTGLLGGLTAGFGSTFLILVYLLQKIAQADDAVVSPHGKLFQFWHLSVATAASFALLASGAFVLRLRRYLFGR